MKCGKMKIINTTNVWINKEKLFCNGTLDQVNSYFLFIFISTTSVYDAYMVGADLSMSACGN